MEIANNKIGDPFYFYYDPPGNPPKPVEIAIFAYSRWLKVSCSIDRLFTSWPKWSDWSSNQDFLIRWFSSLSERQRRDFTPWFTDVTQYHYQRDIWTGWIHEGEWIVYKSIPKNHLDFAKAKGPIKPDRDPEDNELWNREYPFIGRFNPREHAWYWLAFRTAEAYTIARRETLGLQPLRLRRRIEDYKPSGSSRASNKAAKEYTVDWLNAMLESPARAIEWYCSLSENERQLVTPSYASKIGPGPHSTLFYENGQARIEYLDTQDPRFVNALEW